MVFFKEYSYKTLKFNFKNETFSKLCDSKIIHYKITAKTYCLVKTTKLKCPNIYNIQELQKTLTGVI